MLLSNRKKIIFTLLFSIAVLSGAMILEYLSSGNTTEDLIQEFEKRLHAEERKADNILRQFTDSASVAHHPRDEDIIMAGLKNGKLFFWTNEIIGINGLYDLVPSGKKFLNINNSYYELRRHSYEDIEYIAFLHIKDNFPYTNKYIRNHFGKFLKIKAENIDHIEISPEPLNGSAEIKNIDGETIFYIRYSENYKDLSINYILLGLYVLFFLTLFYLYDIILKSILSLKWQLLFVAGFVLFFVLLYKFMHAYRLPDVLYQLRIFEPSQHADQIVISIGNMLISTFAITQILYISFSGIKVNYKSPRVLRFRYVGLTVFCLLILFYIMMYTYTLQSLIKSGDVYLNIARVMEVDIVSIVAFICIIIAGLGMIILMDGVVSMMRNIIPLKKVWQFGTLLFLPVVLIFGIMGYSIQFWGCLFVVVIYALLVLNCRVKKREVQRAIYLLIMLFLSIYIVLTERYFEQEKEITIRKNFALELITERDHNLEKKLVEIDKLIKESDSVAYFVEHYNEKQLADFFHSGFLNMTGYNYAYTFVLCRPEDVLNVGNENKLYNCNDYFNGLIHLSGVKLGDTDFYMLNIFDGLTSYIGRYVFREACIILRFDSANESEGKGYPQILSRQSTDGGCINFPYSYAKYKNGQLVKSSGFFNYYKSLTHLGEYNKEESIIEKDGYSHMFIPVDKENMLIISLHASFFSIYYLNILYVFFICILFSSYGMFFNLNSGVNFKKGSLKARIKNSILMLVVALFIILTIFSVIFITHSFEKRHQLKITELLKYLNKELETLDCVEYTKCHEITETLAAWSEILSVDINIYSDLGRLVATSRPEIFANGFLGYLADPEACKNIVSENATSFVKEKYIGEIPYMSAYMPLQLSDNKLYILNVPYFAETDELNQNIFIFIIVIMNIAVVIMMFTFIMAGIIADTVTKPLQLVNDKLKRMRLGGRNEKIDYDLQDEVGGLVREYNNMVEKLEENVKQIARSERESAWREMARQIAHEIKNPLTPMKLNIQFMQRSLQVNDPQEFRERFKDISNVLIEQIDRMATIASVFSDFAKISKTTVLKFDVSELMMSCIKLFEKNVDILKYNIEPEIFLSADKEQVHRLFVNIIKNAVQSIPEGKEGIVFISLKKEENGIKISIRDNGTGIPENIREKIFEPNFTTKTTGTGLGLAISKRIVENNGGDIEFVSSNEGTEFIITFKQQHNLS